MKTAYKLTIDSKNCIGLLFIVSEKSGTKNSRQNAAAEREAAGGYIMNDERECGFCRFDITTILGDMMTENNAVFDFIKATVEKPERFIYVQNCLEEYFSSGDYTVQRISQLMGKHKAPFGETEKKGVTVYHCSDLPQVAFSILHFLILDGYKFSNCKHCGRLYATKTLKTVYCNRKSLYSGYEQYSCKDAVKHINDTLEKRRKVVYERLRVKADEYGYHSKYGEVFRTFQNRCTNYKTTIKKIASVDNLQQYNRYLQSGEGLPKRYERIKETMK